MKNLDMKNLYLYIGNMLDVKSVTSETDTSEQEKLDYLIELYAKVYADRKLSIILMHMATEYLIEEDVPLEELRGLMDKQDKFLQYLKENIFTIKDK